MIDANIVKTVYLLHNNRLGVSQELHEIFKKALAYAHVGHMEMLYKPSNPMNQSTIDYLESYGYKVMLNGFTYTISWGEYPKGLTTFSKDSCM